MYRVLKTAGLVVVAIIAMRWFGLTPERAVADSKALIRGDFVERTKERLRAEAANVPVAAEDGQQDDVLNRELRAERKRIMEEKANTLEKYGNQIAKGDVESVKRQVEENARLAGGNQ